MIKEVMACNGNGCDRPYNCETCPNHKEYIYICDKCGAEVDHLFKTGDGSFCDECTIEWVKETVEDDPLDNELLKALDVEEVE